MMQASGRTFAEPQGLCSGDHFTSHTNACSSYMRHIHVCHIDWEIFHIELALIFMSHIHDDKLPQRAATRVLVHGTNVFLRCGIESYEPLEASKHEQYVWLHHNLLRKRITFLKSSPRKPSRIPFCTRAALPSCLQRKAELALRVETT